MDERVASKSTGFVSVSSAIRRQLLFYSFILGAEFHL